MPVERRGRDHKHFMEIMGKGISTVSGMQQGKQDSQTQKQGPDSRSPKTWKPGEREAAIARGKALDLQIFNEAKPASGYEKPYPSGKMEEDSMWQQLKEFGSQIAQEVREQWSGFDMDCIEAFKRGDRIGLPFEGGATFQPINEHLLEMALKSSQGSDESSIVDCFLKFVADYNYTTREQFVWDWVNYHQLHHGTGYGRTMKDHFNLLSYMRKHTEKYPDLDSRLNKLAEISKDADSFGNGSLALVYPAYFYGFVVGEEPAEFVRYLTSFTHTNEDVTRAVNLLMDIIEGKHVDAPTEEFIRKNCFAEHATAYNTLLTAMYIADAGTEMEVIRRGVWVGGDTDSTLATAMLLWILKLKS